MIQKAFLIHAKPGMAGEYQKRHNPIWPEMETALKKYGVRNYSIFLHEDTGALFGYLEIEDENLFSSIGDSEVCQRWWKYMKEVLISESDESKMAKEEILKEVFNLSQKNLNS
jgi:L-rhamnose mutarotase